MAEVAVTIECLQRAITAAEPAAFLVPPRLLRRAIRAMGGRSFVGLSVPHSQCLAIGGAAALRVIEPEELGLDPNADPPDMLYLLARPDPDELAALPSGHGLIDAWRRLFHARVHAELERRLPARAADLLGRIRRIGEVEFDEIRAVLRREDMILPPADDRAIFIEFAAVYLELRHFRDVLLPDYFPALRDLARIDALLAEDVEADALFRRTRPVGAPDPSPFGVYEGAGTESPPIAEAEARRSGPACRRLMRRADEAERAGNQVRAILLRRRAERLAGPGRAGRARSAIESALDVLARRLRAALGLDEAERVAWRSALEVLLPRAAGGRWPAEARLLYDLQKVCVDHEREVFAVDPWGWLRSFGRRPLRRLLPNQREVLEVKHLRQATRRLGKVRLDDADRSRLADLLHAAVARAEHGLRERLRPLIARALERSDILPRNLPERVAARKLTEELLDKVAGREFVAMGDLRDALSRSHLKLPDLAGPREFFRGDRLLRADRRLAVSLDGVYRRGEIYLRVLQRLSALAFGTRAGRSLTLSLVLPFGGAFVLLEGLDHLVGPLVHWATGRHMHLLTPASVAGVGVAALALIHVEAARRWSRSGLLGLGRGLRAAFVVLPSRVLDHPIVRRVVAGGPFRFAWRWLLKPSIPTAIGWGAMTAWGLDGEAAAWLAAASFLAAILVLNSRAGRDLEEEVVEGFGRGWHRLRSDLLPGLYRIVMGSFDRRLDAVERALDSVDEWLRFRSGEGKGSLAIKAVLAAIWSVVTYVVRFAINLLAEPQLNPIKHFPVVTVSHKVIAPIILLQMPPLLMVALGMDVVTANGIAWSTQLLLPGVFGFLVWELKENWKLYEANRSRLLRPVTIGHHGETMPRLLRPGFHSGTVPKLFDRLRRADRRARRSGAGVAAHRPRESLHHVEESVRHFIERELLELLRAVPPFATSRLVPGAIDLATNRVAVGLLCHDRPGGQATIAFEERSGCLVAGLTDPGWIAGLDGAGRRALETALAGVYQMAGVDLVREQVDAGLGLPAFELAEAGPVTWPRDGSEASAIHDLRDGPNVSPRPPLDGLPTLDARRVAFRHLPMTWRAWVEAWDEGGTGRINPAESAVAATPPPPRA